MDHAERALPLDALAAGPQDRLLPAGGRRRGRPRARAARAGDAAGALVGAAVATALLSPVIFIRNGALRALEQTEPREWGAPVEAALARLVEIEPTDDVRTRARAQLTRLA